MDVTTYPWPFHSFRHLQYIPRNMHTVFALLCFVVVIHWLIFPYPPGLLQWHCGNLTIAPVPAKQPWWIWINTSCEISMNDYITTTEQSITKPCAYFLGYTVWGCCIIGYPFEIDLKPKSREIALVHNLFLNRPTVLKFCTEYDSDPVVLCSQFQNDLRTEINVMDDQDFARFYFLPVSEGYHILQ